MVAQSDKELFQIKTEFQFEKWRNTDSVFRNATVQQWITIAAV